MAVELHNVTVREPRASVTVEEVDAGTLDDWSRVLAIAFGCPPEFVGVPAAYERSVGLPGVSRVTPLPSPGTTTNQLRRQPYSVDSAGSGLAGIYNVGTLPEAHEQGFGRYATLVAMHAARATGATVAVLQASELGIPVYDRLGFATVGHIEAYLPPAG